MCQGQTLSGDLQVGIEVEAKGVKHSCSDFPFAKQDVLPQVVKL